MKTRGMVELRKEMENLQTHYKPALTETELKELQQQHSQYHERVNQRQWSLEEGPTTEMPPPALMAKRKSLPAPGNFDLAPHQLLALKQSMHVEQQLDTAPVTTTPPSGGGGGDDGSPPTGQYAIQGSPPNKSLQHQLLQHRIQQKRQVFQKHPQLSQTLPLYQEFQQMHIDSQNAPNQGGIPPPQKQQPPLPPQQPSQLSAQQQHQLLTQHNLLSSTGHTPPAMLG